MIRRMAQCRCGRTDVIAVAPGVSATVHDLRIGLVRIPLDGFPIGWRMYAWGAARGKIAHVETVRPDCPAPKRKNGEPDTDAVEIDRAGKLP